MVQVDAFGVNLILGHRKGDERLASESSDICLDSKHESVQIRGYHVARVNRLEILPIREPAGAEIETAFGGAREVPINFPFDV